MAKNQAILNDVIRTVGNIIVVLSNFNELSDEEFDHLLSGIDNLKAGVVNAKIVNEITN